jgi:NAD(P)-dependent dehydrogenase (short-subunit alcohol dehydrogenase family)
MQAKHLEALDIGGYGSRGRYRVVVTGAASGIGRAAAQRFLAMQCEVIAVDRDEAGLASLAAAHPGVIARPADLLDAPQVREALALSPGAVGYIDALVNCVGITGKTNVPAAAVDLTDFERVVAINMRTALVLSQAVLPGMVAQGFGRILHVASIAGKEGNAGMTAYSASKAGLIGLVKSMAKDYATSGVTVNALAPAVIRTPLVDALPQATVDYMTQRIPMQRCGTLQEVAATIAWIVSPACSFCTGFAFDLSGGRATY